MPSLAATVAGEPIRGSWWSHPKANEIYMLAEAIRDSDDVVTCRLVDGKITFVHRRVWPALVRLADRFEKKHLAKVVSEHTPSGKHVTHETPFPDWVPAAAVREGKKMSMEDAEGVLPVAELLGYSVAGSGDQATQKRSNPATKSERRPVAKQRRR